MAFCDKITSKNLICMCSDVYSGSACVRVRENKLERFCVWWIYKYVYALPCVRERLCMYYTIKDVSPFFGKITRYIVFLNIRMFQSNNNQSQGRPFWKISPPPSLFPNSLPTDGTDVIDIVIDDVTNRETQDWHVVIELGWLLTLIRQLIRRIWCKEEF